MTEKVENALPDDDSSPGATEDVIKPQIQLDAVAHEPVGARLKQRSEVKEPATNPATGDTPEWVQRIRDNIVEAKKEIKAVGNDVIRVTNSLAQLKTLQADVSQVRNEIRESHSNLQKGLDRKPTGTSPYDWNLFTVGTLVTCLLLGILLLVSLIKIGSAQSGAEEAAKRASEAAEKATALSTKVNELASRPAAAPSTPAPAPQIPPDLAEKIEGFQTTFKKLQEEVSGLDKNLALTNTVTKVNRSVEELTKKVDSLRPDGSKKPDGGTPISDNNVINKLAVIHTLIDERLPDPKKGPARSNPAADRESVRNALKEVLGTKEVQDQLADTILARWKKEGPNPKDLENAVNKRFDELAKMVKESVNRSATPSEAEDVIVLTTHSRILPANEYVDAYKRLFSSLPRDPGGKYRLGFCVATTGNLEVKVPLRNGTVKPDTFVLYKPTGDETERPDRVGEALRDQFDEKRPHPRCVLVASARCEAPRPDAAGWRDVQGVDVVLLRPPGLTGGAALGPWMDFCQARKGTLTILTPGKDRLDEQLFQTLLRLAAPRRIGP